MPCSGLKADAGAFFTFVLIALLGGYAAVSVALFYSATFGSFAVASIFITLTFVFSVVSKSRWQIDAPHL